MALVLLLGDFSVFSELGGQVRVEFLLVGVARVVGSGCVGITGVARVVFIVVVFIFIRVGSGGVAGVGTLALVIGALRLWSGWSFSGHLRASFPVMRIDDWARVQRSERVLGLPMRAISSLIQDRSPQYSCWHRMALPHWTWVVR